MTSSNPSPRITHLSWGRLEVEEGGATHTYKDAKLWPGGSRGWDWNETGTRHVPGIQPDDVAELLDQGAQTIILSKGINERLQVKDETLQFLEERGIDTEVLQSEKAVARYNELRDRETVGALIHSTC